jgi:hypothetical protein
LANKNAYSLAIRKKKERKKEGKKERILELGR